MLLRKPDFPDQADSHHGLTTTLQDCDTDISACSPLAEVFETPRTCILTNFIQYYT